MKRPFRLAALGAAALMLLSLTGCLMKSADELYRVPQRSSAYIHLQQAAEKAMGASGSYCAPQSGSNRQAIQTADVDGDGQDEYLAYCMVPGEHPLKTFVFRRSGDDFKLLCTLEGDGTAFDSVQYVQMDGAEGMELLIGRRVSEQKLQSVGVYTIKNDEPVELLSASYAYYSTLDLTNDDRTDLLLVHSDSELRNAVAELYFWKDGALNRSNQVDLSAPVENVKRILTGNMVTDVPAVFIASTYDENNIVTDILAVVDGSFRNVSLSNESGISAQTVRSYYVFSEDIDGDGLTEIPSTVSLPSVSWDVSSEDQTMILWVNINPDGSRTEKLRTYHNYSSGWYLVLPPAWTEDLLVTRRITGNSLNYVFCTLEEDGNTIREIMTLYSLTGTDAEERSSSESRILLGHSGSTWYSASLGTTEYTTEMDEEAIRSLFHLFSTDANK